MQNYQINNLVFYSKVIIIIQFLFIFKKHKSIKKTY